MLYTRGDRVDVRGYAGKKAVLVVWNPLKKGLLLCTEDGFERRMAGEDAPAIGFPIQDILGLHESAEKEFTRDV